MRTPLRQARTLLRRASDKSQIDILKTLLTDFFADLGEKYVTLTLFFFFKISKSSKVMTLLKF